MRAFLSFIILLIPAALSAERPTIEQIRSHAGSCTIAVIGCDLDKAGKLETGDCLFSDGSRYDIWSFQGVEGEIVEVTVRPLSETFSKPWVALIPPLADPSEPPIISGGAGGVTIRYLLGTSGTWGVAVSSDDLFAGGDYVLHVYCAADDEPSQPAGCVVQDLLCGQSAEWTLNADSCRFSSTPKAFAIWEIYAAAGDVLRFGQTGIGFEPLFGIYKDGKLLRSSSRESTRKHTMSHFVEETGWYVFLTTTAEENQGGDFDVTLNCNRSGCTFPYLIGPVPTTVTAYGTPAVVQFSANAVGGFVATLRQDFETLATSTTNSIVTPPIRVPQRYVIDLANPCGEWTSDPFLVLPASMPRRRAVKK
jgi:hypothetical protein